ncbi:Thymidylate synthase [compost metagenome]
MHQFQGLIEKVLYTGSDREDRTGIGTRSIFGHQMRFDLSEGFPICTTKRVPFKSVLSELLWFISGSTNVNDLRALLHGEEFRDDWTKKTIWDDNATNQGQALGYEDGELGPVYGKQWRHWSKNNGVTDLLGAKDTIDQLRDVINQIRDNPDSRRLIVSAWNVAELPDMALPPCHCLFQFYVRDGYLDCQLYQRSADLFLGVPFNIASYALLVHMVAQVCSLKPGEFIWTGGDVHLYKNHFSQALEILNREPLKLPTLEINPEISDIDQFTMNDFELIDYKSHPPVPAPMAV